MTTTSIARLGFKSQVAFVLAFYIGLFFVEYPPLFLLGYWTWGGLVHKTITGILLAVNLIITQYAAKRLGLFSRVEKVGNGKADSGGKGLSFASLRGAEGLAGEVLPSLTLRALETLL
jgi:hypothetical protein